MDNKQTILVTGASGAQGGSVARHLLADGTFHVRCLLRNTQSSKAEALALAGAELVQGDMSDLNSIIEAMKGVYGVFAVTNFWEHFAEEESHGINLIDAAVAANVDYFMYSSLPPAEKISKGVYPVPHFDIKAKLQDYAKLVKPDSSFVHVAGYYENMTSYILPRKGADGVYYWRIPQGDTRYASFAVEDLGGVVLSMFKHPEVYKGRTVGVVGADMHCAEYAAILSKVLEIPVVYEHVSQEAYTALGFPGAKELADMYSFNREYILNRQLDLIESNGLYPAMQDFETWARANKKVFQQVLQLEKEAAA
jgi:uncharacterized protein YbjT (DUF2867 family)